MKLFDKLDAPCPQGFTTAGATLFFRQCLTPREARRAFHLFPVVNCVQDRRGYWLRDDFPDCAQDPNCGAYKAAQAVKATCTDGRTLTLDDSEHNSPRP